MNGFWGRSAVLSSEDAGATQFVRPETIRELPDRMLWRIRRPKQSLRSFHLMNQMVAIPANWFQILDSMAPPVRPVLAMVNLQSPVVVAAATPPARLSQNFKTVDLVHLAHENAKGKLIAAMSRLGHQFIAAESGIRILAGRVSIAQPAHFIARQALRLF
jgi:hypothetical protein